MTFFLVLLGLAFGSFVNALVWRLHKKRNFISERSECTHCHHLLAWYDLIPVVSWIILKGRCRYCHKKIDDSPLTEIGVAAVFGLSYAFWPLGFSPGGIILFVLWLMMVVLLAALFLYDLKWMLLPDVLVFPLIGLGLVWAGVYYATIEPLSLLAALREIALGLTSVAGIYGLLYILSKGEWVGFGDVKLGIFMGLVLGWWKGLLAIVLANFIAFAWVLPGLVRGNVKRSSRIPFGPFLIVATVIAFLFGESLIGWYFSMTFGLE